MRVNGNLETDEIQNVIVETGTVAPAAPNTGQWWFDTNVLKLKVWDGSSWKLFAGSATGSGIIVGTVLALPYAPAGEPLIFCNGAAINRTTYADLFSAIGTSYGIGNGTTTFNIPDLRGEFIRGRAAGSGYDPDRASRTNRGDGTVGDNTGTRQLTMHAYHKHASNLLIPNHDVNILAQTGAQTGIYSLYTYYAQASSYYGGNESRPRNVYVNYYIKV